MFLKAKLPIWVFVLIAAIGLATSFLLVNYGVSVLSEMDLQSLENAYWTKKISQKDTLANWQTYRNYEYGFEVKYPKDWSISDNREHYFQVIKELKTKQRRVEGDMSGICKISWNGLENPELLSLSEWLKQKDEETGTPPLDETIIETIINGIKGVKILTEEVGLATNIYLPKLDKIVRFGLLCGDDVLDDGTMILNQILSTFKFIEGKVTENGYKTDYIYKTGASGVVESSQLVFVSPEGNKILIPDNIAILIDGPTQDITSFDMPLHPQNKDVIFLSTYEPLNKTYSRIANRIYSYNLKTSELKEIYYEVAENNSPIDDSKARILITVGREESKIIVLYDDPENWPGPCTRIWYHYKDQMGYLDLAYIQSGLKSYIVPIYKVEEDRIEANKCLEEL